MAEKRVAVIGGQGLGDNLIEMVLMENSRRAGLRATMFCTRMMQMAAWFPLYHIVETLPMEVFDTALAEFDIVLCPGGRLPGIALADWIYYNELFQEGVPRAVNIERLCVQLFEGSFAVTKTNGIMPPESLTYRRNAQRVCIHPTSAELSKNWLPDRFLALAARLEQRGFVPVFIMSEAEQSSWQPVIGSSYGLHGFATIADCAAFIYESGYFIGNDSGGGHLASCLDIPTLSIHGRKGKARDWRPAWGRVEVVWPRINLIGGNLRQQYWKYFLSVGAVERAFDRLLD